MATNTTTHTAIPPAPDPKPWRWWLSKFFAAALFFAAGVLIIVVLGLAQRMGWLSTDGAASITSEAGADQVYTCAMHPQIRQDQPGRCPICGMALVLAKSDDVDLDEFAVHIEPAQRRLANIQTAPVEREPINALIETIGAIEVDESRQATIAAYIDGRIERLFADYTGVEVDKGDHLAVLYSPELYAAQVEFIEAKKALREMTSGALASVRKVQEKLVVNARRKIVELGMTDEQLADLERTEEPQSRLTIYSPIGGTVIDKMAEEGKYVSAGEPIYRIANLSTVWLMLELYPEDAGRIRFGQRVEAELTSNPGVTLVGRVAFIDPTVNTDKRTVGVRVEFSNDDKRLRPGDYARATIAVPIGSRGDVYDESLAGKWISPMHPQIIRDEPGDCPICGMQLVPTTRYGYSETEVARPESLVVPRSAVLMAGSNSVIYVETEPGRFELRNITLGPILQNIAVILEGVDVGEMVATSGNFLIDSQMQLAGKPSLIDPTRFKKSSNDQPRNTPLEFDHIHVEPIAGETGEQIERLYATYFRIQQTLADDTLPTDDDATTLHQLAADLSQNEDFDEAVRKRFAAIAEAGEHLHHLELDEARKDFKPISHAVIALSTQVRGSGAVEDFYHFFCPMVKGGAGDWLQPGEPLRNPYYGSQMLDCGDLVQTIPAQTDHVHQHEGDR